MAMPTVDEQDDGAANPVSRAGDAPAKDEPATKTGPGGAAVPPQKVADADKMKDAALPNGTTPVSIKPNDVKVDGATKDKVTDEAIHRILSGDAAFREAIQKALGLQVSTD
ncbi:hypothetical protein NX059_000376 [Plenodomus lindquistii]|nr:hypothetical protein NX059_000376 [Plenodomus lindquistii]